MGFLLGLWELKRLDIKVCMVKRYSSIVISWELGKGSGLWCLSSIMCEIWELVVCLSISLSHVDKRQNALADRLANTVAYSLLYFENYIPEDW